MGDRKVSSKYYPPDFDPTKLGRVVKSKRSRDKVSGRDQTVVRFALPFSVRCKQCGEFMGRGRKFNTRKETVQGRTYRGIRIFRFYQRCIRCSSEFTILTDPEHADYTAELGVGRHFEPWKEEEREKEAAEAERVEEEADSALKTLEMRSAESRREMDELDALDELRGIRDKQEALRSGAGADAVLIRNDIASGSLDQDAADEAELASTVFRNSSSFVSRIPEHVQAPVLGTRALAPTAKPASQPAPSVSSGPGITRGLLGTSAHARTRTKSQVSAKLIQRANPPPTGPLVVVRPRVVAAAKLPSPKTTQNSADSPKDGIRSLVDY